MKQLLSIIVIVVLLPIMALAGPRIFVPETQFDFGVVPQNVTISHPYVIKNIGDDTLRILQVKPG